MIQKSLELVCDLITDGTHYTPPNFGHGYPFLTVKDMSEFGLDFENCSYVEENEYKKALNGNCVPFRGDVLFSKDGTVGKVHVVKETNPFAVLSSIAILRPNNEILDSGYFGHVLRTPKTISQAFSLKTGSALRRIVLSDLRKIQIPLPPLDEQRRIAAILDKADAIRRKRQESIRLTEEFLRSTFLDMFGDPLMNPKGWEVVAFGDFCEELRYGTSVMCNSVKQAGDLPVLRIPNVIGSRILLEGLKYASLSEAEIKRLKLVEGDILFVRTNGNPEYIGRCAVYEGNNDAIYASYLIRGRMKAATKLLPHYAQFCFSLPTYRSRIVAEAQTTAGNYNINTEGLRSLRLPLPPLKKQQDFIEMRRKVMDSTSKLIIGEDASIELFNSLTHRAFRGEL